MQFYKAFRGIYQGVAFVFSWFFFQTLQIHTYLFKEFLVYTGLPSMVFILLDFVFLCFSCIVKYFEYVEATLNNMETDRKTKKLTINQGEANRMSRALGTIQHSMHAEDWFLWGRESNYRVRMSNRIVENTAVLIRLILHFKPLTYVMLEQPKGSYMFKLPCFQKLFRDFAMGMILTYMGLYGGELLKGTHLWSNLPTLCCKKLNDFI